MKKAQTMYLPTPHESIGTIVSRCHNNGGDSLDSDIINELMAEIRQEFKEKHGLEIDSTVFRISVETDYDRSIEGYTISHTEWTPNPNYAKELKAYRKWKKDEEAKTKRAQDERLLKDLKAIMASADETAARIAELEASLAKKGT